MFLIRVSILAEQVEIIGTIILLATIGGLIMFLLVLVLWKLFLKVIDWFLDFIDDEDDFIVPPPEPLDNWPW